MVNIPHVTQFSFASGFFLWLPVFYCRAYHDLFISQMLKIIWFPFFPPPIRDSVAINIFFFHKYLYVHSWLVFLRQIPKIKITGLKYMCVFKVYEAGFKHSALYLESPFPQKRVHLYKVLLKVSGSQEAMGSGSEASGCKTEIRKWPRTTLFRQLSLASSDHSSLQFQTQL